VTSTGDPFVELRGEILREHVDVIDAVVQATPGASRMSVLRRIVAEWADRKVHEASLIHRVAGNNGTAPQACRHRNGSRAETP